MNAPASKKLREPMTLADVAGRVTAIAEADGDFEAQHSLEDALYRDLLIYLGEVAPAELGALARLAVTTQGIDFPRYCA